jgi:hypothetical protein
MKCKICGEEFVEPSKFHRHLPSKHKTTMEKYYHQYHPRHDLLTGDPILFKSYDWYFSSLFNSRSNMITFFKSHPNRKEEICARLIKLAKKRKQLTTAPDTVYSRTSMLLTPAQIAKIGLDYSSLCAAEDLKLTRDYSIRSIAGKIPEDFEITVDTREQKPLAFSGFRLVADKLDFGDYASISHFKRVFVERKSLSDLCGTLSGGFERFQNEIKRAAEMSCNLVVVCESPIEDLVNLSSSVKFTKASSEFICHRVRELLSAFNNLQFLFLKSRQDMEIIVPKLLYADFDFFKADLQYIYDCGGLQA